MCFGSGPSILFRHYYKSVAKSAGNFRDGAAVPCGSVSIHLHLELVVLSGVRPLCYLSVCSNSAACGMLFGVSTPAATNHPREKRNLDD